MPLTSPRAIPDSSRALAASAPAPGTASIRIAIADGQSIRRAGIRKLLTFKGDFQVVAEARNGKEVSEVVEEYRPDILLLDLTISSLDGLTVLRRLRHSGATTKVIVLAAPEDKAQFVQAMKFGACGIVLKQTGDELLFKSIRKVHAGEIWLDSNTMAAVMRQFSSPLEPVPALTGDPSRFSLSRREREIATLIAQGFKNKEIADKMVISHQTVKNYLRKVFDKLGVSARLDVALYAIYHNLHAPLTPADTRHPPAPNPPGRGKKCPPRHNLPGTPRYAERSAG